MVYFSPTSSTTIPPPTTTTTTIITTSTERPAAQLAQRREAVDDGDPPGDDDALAAAIAGAILNCTTGADIDYVDGDAFAKGYAKTAWRGRYGGKSMVIKRPISAKHLSRFMKGIKWESRWLHSLQHPNIMRYYGECRESGNPFTAVEGDLVKWSWVSLGDVPWCFRVKMIMETVQLLQYLQRMNLVHCDWKYDQMAVDRNGVVKLVDLKSLRHMLNGRPYKSDFACSSHKQCRKCEKMMHLPVEHSCNQTAGLCHGFDSSTMVAVTAQSFIQPLLVTNLREAPPGFAEDVQHLLSMTDRPEPHLRWTAAQTLDYLGDMYRRHQAGSCLASRHDEIKAALAAAYDSMIRDHAFRCKSRYC